MASYSFLAPRPTNAILSDVDHIREIQGILAQWNPSLADDAPEDSKRLVPLDSAKTQYRFERLVGSNWNSVGKLMHDVDTLDGFHASISAVKNTIPVYNADGKLVGDLTGNANTATTLKNVRKLQIGGIASGGSVNFDGSADATIEITQLTVNNANDTAINGILTIKHGGTGASDAATARTQLGVPAIDHSSTAKTYGVSSTTKYGHAIGSDAINSTFTADKGYFFSPKGASDLNTALRAELDTKFNKGGGLLSGILQIVEADNIISYTNDTETNYKYLTIMADEWNTGSRIQLFRADSPNSPSEIVMFSGADAYFRLRPDGSAHLKHGTILTDAGGTVNGVVRQSVGDIIVASRDDMWTSLKGGSAHNRGAAIILYGQDMSGGAGGVAQLQAYKDGVGVSSLSLWPNGDADINGNSILTSAGGITSWLTIQNTQTHESGFLYAADKTFFVGGRGADGRDSAFIRFYYLDEPKDPGAFMVSTRTQDGHWGPVLFGAPNGNLFWNNANVITSAGGTFNNALWMGLDDCILRNVNNGRLVLLGGPDWNRAAFLELCGGDNTGRVMLNARDGVNSTQFRLEPSGTAYVNSVPIRTVVAFYNDGYNWYRKYSDNWIEQGGLLDANRSGTITFPLPFIYGPTTCVISGILTSYSRNDDGGIYLNSYPSTTSFSYSDNGDASSVRCYWYACGV